MLFKLTKHPLTSLLVPCLGFMTLFVFKVSALTFSLGNVSAVAGGTATIPVTASGAPTNLSAFCFFVTNAPGFGLPAVITGTAQSNLVSFVDDFGGGIYRVTGFVTNNPPIGNGVIAQLRYSVPAGVAPGTYPLLLPSAPPANAPSGPNPEARSLATSSLIANAGSAGSILIGTVSPPLLTSPTRLGNGVFQFSFTNFSGVGFTVLATTNIKLALTNWTPIGPATEISSGQYQFTDSAATNFLSRFYGVRSP